MVARIYIKADGIPETIRRARKNLGMTQKQFADKLGLKSSATISHYERGLRDVPLLTLERIAEMSGWDMKIAFFSKMKNAMTNQK